MHIKTFKAQTMVDRGNPVPSLVISFEKECPTTQTLAGQRNLFKQEAKQICDSLFKHLPGGLVSHITAELMNRQASLLVVPVQESIDDES